MSNRNLTDDQRFMIGNYLRQYNQANSQINNLYSVLAEIRRNIENVYTMQPSRQSQRRSNILEQYDLNIFNIPLSGSSRNVNNNNLLSQQEIEEYTITTTFSNIISPINTECPIRLEEFNDTDIVTQIRHCGHIFNEDELSNWFLTNNRCPVCRHNLRLSSTQNMSQIVNDYSSSLLTQLLAGIFDVSNNTINDMSGNFINRTNPNNNSQT
jgi:Ring finger domain